MANVVFKLLKKTYGKLSRYPWIVQLREAYRKNIQSRYWPWYRHKPTACGIEPDTRRYKHELVVSLTSFPARIHLVHFAIYSLLKQSMKPNRVVLWLGEDKFPGREKDLPSALLELKALGLEIRWCKDLKPATKLIPSLREWPEAIIVTADDDLYYPRHWLQSLYRSYLENENNIHSGGVHPIALDADGKPLSYAEWGWNPADSFPSFQNTQVASFGALYPPHCLHPDVMDGAAFLRVSPSNDDFWFWAMAVRAGTRIQLVPSGRQPPIAIPGGNDTPTLFSLNGKGGGNDLCMANLLRAYPELLSRLASEPRQEVTPWCDTPPE